MLSQIQRLESRLDIEDNGHFQFQVLLLRLSVPGGRQELIGTRRELTTWSETPDPALPRFEELIRMAE